MVNNYTKIKPSICLFCIHLDENMTSFQSYDVMMNTLSSAVSGGKKPEGSTAKYYFTCSLDSNVVMHPPYNPDFTLPPVTF